MVSNFSSFPVYSSPSSSSSSSFSSSLPLLVTSSASSYITPFFSSFFISSLSFRYWLFINSPSPLLPLAPPWLSFFHFYYQFQLFPFQFRIPGPPPLHATACFISLGPQPSFLPSSLCVSFPFSISFSFSLCILPFHLSFGTLL